MTLAQSTLPKISLSLKKKKSGSPLTFKVCTKSLPGKDFTKRKKSNEILYVLLNLKLAPFF